MKFEQSRYCAVYVTLHPVCFRVIFEGSMNVLYNSMQAADLLQPVVSAGQEIEDTYTKTRRTTVNVHLGSSISQQRFDP